MPYSELAQQSGAFETLLRAEMADYGAGKYARFAARNALIDENVTADRARSYLSSMPTASLSRRIWHRSHDAYLARVVGFTKSVLRNDARSTWPETFREDRQLSVLSHADPHTQLARLESVDRMQQRIPGVSAGELVDVATDALRGDAAAMSVLNSHLAVWHASRDDRPVFIGLWDDVVGDLTAPDWPNVLRDRFGLEYLRGLPSPAVFLFRYKLGRIPKLAPRSAQRAIASPTVLDTSPSPPFCPAPRPLEHGMAVNLSGLSHCDPAREALHLRVRVTGADLGRIGQLTAPPRVDLAEARKQHIQCLRRDSRFPDYARETDSDIAP